jgi:regulator of RNase E activity RraA
MRDTTREKLKHVSVATLTTALFKRGLRHQFIQDVHPLNYGAGNMVGEAFTLRYIPAREDLNPITVFQNRDHPQRKAVEECPPGAVMVIDSRKDARAASAGAILVTRLMKRGVAGIVTDGGFRDSPEIAKLAIPAYHHRPAAPTNLTLHQALDINVPIGCGDAPVFPGDIIVGDGEGVGSTSHPSRRRTSRRGRRDDRVRGFRSGRGAERALDPWPLSSYRSTVAERLCRMAFQA